MRLDPLKTPALFCRGILTVHSIFGIVTLGLMYTFLAYFEKKIFGPRKCTFPYEVLHRNTYSWHTGTFEALNCVFVCLWTTFEQLQLQ